MQLSVLWNHSRSLLLCLLCFFFSAPLSLEAASFYLKARTEPLYPDYLASFHVETPDPCTCFLGEQIVVFYGFPGSYPCKELLLQINYRDGSFETVSFKLFKRKGFFIFRLVNDEYWQKGGFLAYKIALLVDGEEVKTWKHQLYVDLIKI